MKRKFCCDASRQMYEDYYAQQSGSGLPIFVGGRGQRGHGIGSVLSGLFRSAVPFLKRGMKFLGKQALKTGAEIASDVADGKDFAESARQRVGARVNQYIPGSIPHSGGGIYPINSFSPPFASQFGSGSRRRRIKSNKRSKKIKRDILE